MTVAPPQTSSPPLRIGDVARIVGTTPRTIRYYEEIGLLPDTQATRPPGQHRLYSEAEIERLREIIRLKRLTGVTLDELKTLIEAEEARATIRRELDDTEDPGRRRELLKRAVGHLDRQLELVDRRARELAGLQEELQARRRRVLTRLRELDKASV
jgi:DNA-binding transcriptional MerR regulator